MIVDNGNSPNISLFVRWMGEAFKTETEKQKPLFETTKKNLIGGYEFDFVGDGRLTTNVDGI